MEISYKFEYTQVNHTRFSLFKEFQTNFLFQSSHQEIAVPFVTGNPGNSFLNVLRICIINRHFQLYIISNLQNAFEEDWLFKLNVLFIFSQTETFKNSYFMGLSLMQWTTS